MPSWFQLGGFAMWITLPFGALSVVAAALYARRPERRLVPLVLSLGVMTLMSGSLGFVTGVIKSLQALPHVGPDERWIWMVGLSESLVNVAFALSLVAVATLAMVVGTWRLSRPRLLYAPDPEASV